jgi:hypothetical protein
LEKRVSVAGYSWDHHHGVTTCSHVFEGKPVRLFSFDSDRDLQFLCGANDHDDRTTAVHAGLNHLMDQHPEIATLPLMGPGQWAERSNENSDWVVGQLDADDFEEGVTQ